MCCASLRPA
jgi:NAD(P)-dependent dehydrogenase (short-subunit alcohol dehydrogenase family)